MILHQHFIHNLHESDSKRQRQGTATRSGGEQRISSSHKRFIWLKDSNSAWTRLKFNQHSAAHWTAVARAKHFAFREGGATVGFWVRAIFFWTKLSRTHRNSLCFVRQMLCDCKIQGTTRRFKSFHIIFCQLPSHVGAWYRMTLLLEQNH